MSETAPFVWSESFRIRAYEVGPDERGSILTICNLFQEAAGEHARSANVETFELPSGPGTWVLNRLRVQAISRPMMRERVEIETWPSARDGLRAYRDFICWGEDGREIARGTSAWLVLDVARRRAVRLPEVISLFGPPERPRALLFESKSISAPDPSQTERCFDVRRSDLDRVGHANNVRFAEWALEAVPEPIVAEHTLADLDLQFHAEAVLGDTVLSSVGLDEANQYSHRLSRVTDDKTLAVARSCWLTTGSDTHV